MFLLSNLIHQYLSLVLVALLFVGAVLSYFKVPVLGKECALILCSTAVGLLCYQRGWAGRAELDHSAELTQQIAVLQSDLRVAQSAAADAKQRADQMNEAYSQAQDRVAQYEQFLNAQADKKVSTPVQKSDPCRLDGNDLRWLRSERTGPFGAAHAARRP